MITLTNHSCSFCQHLNRKERSIHGGWQEYIRKIQQDKQDAIDRRDFDAVRWLNKQETESRQMMERIERGEYTSVMQYNKRQ